MRVDAGYVSARVLVKSQERFGIEVVSPESIDTQWQARTPSGIDASQFELDWEHRQARFSTGKNEHQVDLAQPKAASCAFSRSSVLPAIAARVLAAATVFIQRANTSDEP